MTLDLRSLRQTALSTDRTTLTVQGGAIVKDAIDALPEGCALVTGVSTQVGLAGRLSAGIRKTERPVRPVTDNLKSARVVLADGSCVTVSQQENPDLFWGPQRCW